MSINSSMEKMPSVFSCLLTKHSISERKCQSLMLNPYFKHLVSKCNEEKLCNINWHEAMWKNSLKKRVRNLNSDPFHHSAVISNQRPPPLSEVLLYHCAVVLKCSARAVWQQQWQTSNATQILSSIPFSLATRTDTAETPEKTMTGGASREKECKRNIVTLVLIPWNARSSSCIHQDCSSFFLSFFEHSAFHLYQMLHFNFNFFFALQKAVKPTAALCQQKCKRSGTLESNYCSSNFGKEAKFLFIYSFSTVFLDSGKFSQM